MAALRAIENLLQKGDGGSLVTRAKQLARLERRLQACLDPTVAAHCRLANLRDGLLLVQVPSGAWAARLRYEQPRILSCLRRAGVPVERIEPLVLPPQGAPQPARRAHPISPTSRATLLSAAGAVTHPALSAALRRLAENRG